MKHPGTDHTRPPRTIDHSKFFVITCISNPIRFASRLALYRKFEKHMRDCGAQLVTVELALGDRPFTVTQAGNPMHLQLRTIDEIWHKENMLNLGIAHLNSICHDWKYVAWIDADIEFVDKNFVEETVHALQHYHMIQMFSQAIDLGPRYEIVQTHNGFMWSYTEHDMRAPEKSGYGPYGFWHPGYAWAATREALNSVGGLFDKAVLGSGDHHMALALIGCAERSLPGEISGGYRHAVMQWQDRAEKFIKRDVGHLPGLILHYWHGKKKDRRYRERWEILTKNNYDPTVDLIRDWQGVYQLSDRNIRLRDEIRMYFRQRNEDSIDLD